MKYALTFIFLSSCLIALNGQRLSADEAIEDIKEFSRLIKHESSYYQLQNLNLDSLCNSQIAKIGLLDSLPIIELAYFCEKITYQINDSHASVSYEGDGFQNEIRFPLATAPFRDKVLALQRSKEKGKFEYYNSRFPYLKSIDDKEIILFLEHYSFDNNRFPRQAKLKRGLYDLREIGDLYTRKSDTITEPLKLVLSNVNGSVDTTILLNSNSKKTTWRYPGNLRDLPIRRKMKDGLPFSYSALTKTISEDIAYLMLPKMIGYDDYPDFEEFLEGYLSDIGQSNSKGLIIDIRGNSGGSRDLINTLSKYIVNKNQSPWVANMAFVRSDQNLNEDIGSMNSKYLYSYDSANFNTVQRKAIDIFLEEIKLASDFDRLKFSNPYYMVLEYSESKYIDTPIFILSDEGSFSAASIMASVFKGLQNVTICGTTTNGSSGRSRHFLLPNSNVQIKISTMLSFQRNGFPLDGYGTEPDLEIERDERQIMGYQDSQLLELAKIIEHSKK